MGSDETLADGWEGVRLRVLLAAVATRPRRSIYVPTTTAGTGTGTGARSRSRNRHRHRDRDRSGPVTLAVLACTEGVWTGCVDLCPVSVAASSCGRPRLDGVGETRTDESVNVLPVDRGRQRAGWVRSFFWPAAALDRTDGADARKSNRRSAHCNFRNG